MEPGQSLRHCLAGILPGGPYGLRHCSRRPHHAAVSHPGVPRRRWAAGAWQGRQPWGSAPALMLSARGAAGVAALCPRPRPGHHHPAGLSRLQISGTAGLPVIKLWVTAGSRPALTVAIRPVWSGYIHGIAAIIPEPCPRAAAAELRPGTPGPACRTRSRRLPRDRAGTGLAAPPVSGEDLTARRGRNGEPELTAVPAPRHAPADDFYPRMPYGHITYDEALISELT